MTYFVYILECRDGSYYTGITNDLTRRLKEHNDGRGSKYTRTRLPVSFVSVFECFDKSSALKLELFIKSLKRKDKEVLVKNNPY